MKYNRKHQLQLQRLSPCHHGRECDDTRQCGGRSNCGLYILVVRQ